MLKVRVVGVITVKSGIAVQSIGFNQFLPIGSPEIAINYLDRWGIDEIVVLHIDATIKSESLAKERINSYSHQCGVPLSIGGGINDIEDVKRIISAGADKVVVNSALISNPTMISQAAILYGNQSIVASIDAKLSPNGIYYASTEGGHNPTKLTAWEMAKRAETLGAGEIFINSIDRDGSKKGYDLELIDLVIDSVNIPVIVCGGVGHPKHMKEAINHGASAVAAGNFFHFTEHSVIIAKHSLTQLGSPVRLDSYTNYQNFDVDQNGRITKLTDESLEGLRFLYIPEETI